MTVLPQIRYPIGDRGEGVRVERALEKEDDDDDDDRGRLWPFGRAKCRLSRRRRDAVYLRPCDGTSVGSPHRCVPRFFPFHARLIRHTSNTSGRLFDTVVQRGVVDFPLKVSSERLSTRNVEMSRGS